MTQINGQLAVLGPLPKPWVFTNARTETRSTVNGAAMYSTRMRAPTRIPTAARKEGALETFGNQLLGREGMYD